MQRADVFKKRCIFLSTTNQFRELATEKLHQRLASDDATEWRIIMKLLTRAEAAEILRIKAQTLAVWAVRGVGPAPTKIGRRVVYREDIIFDYANQNTVPRQEK